MVRHYTLSAEDLALIDRRRGDPRNGSGGGDHAFIGRVWSAAAAGRVPGRSPVSVRDPGPAERGDPVHWTLCAARAVGGRHYGDTRAVAAADVKRPHAARRATPTVARDPVAARSKPAAQVGASAISNCDAQEVLRFRAISLIPPIPERTRKVAPGNCDAS